MNPLEGSWSGRTPPPHRPTCLKTQAEYWRLPLYGRHCMTFFSSLTSPDPPNPQVKCRAHKHETLGCRAQHPAARFYVLAVQQRGTGRREVVRCLEGFVCSESSALRVSSIPLNRLNPKPSTTTIWVGFSQGQAPGIESASSPFDAAHRAIESQLLSELLRV